MFKNILIAILLLITTFFIIQRAIFEIKKEEIEEKTFTTIYIQDKEIVETTDCSVVKPIQIKIKANEEKYNQIAQYLFDTELKSYANYQKIKLKNRILQIYVESDLRPDGRPLTSLSSCEIAHLYSVLEKTFTQFDEVDSVELFVGESKVEF